MPADSNVAFADPNVASSTPDNNGAQTPPADGSKPTESWARAWLKEDGSLDHSAFDKAPDEYRPLKKDFERYKNADEFFKGIREERSLLGKKGIVDPLPANATPKEIEERMGLLRKVNGVPEKPDGYGIKRPDDVPEGAWDQKYADTIAALAHKHAVPPAALKELAQAEIEYTKAAMAQNKQAEADFLNAQDKLIRETLVKEGLDFTKGKDLAERAGRRFGVDPANPLMKNASVFMLLSRIGRMMGEDSLVKGDTSDLGIANMSAEQAEKTANDIVKNREHPDYKAYWNGNDPRHAAVVDKVNSLYFTATNKKR